MMSSRLVVNGVNIMLPNRTLLPALTLVALACSPSLAPGGRGNLFEASVHGPSLEGNRLGDPTERNVIIYTPPSYPRVPQPRSPVLYLLRGIGDPNTVWTEAWNEDHPGFGTMQELLDGGIGAGKFSEMIVIMPDCRTTYSGCFYSNSPVKGNWQDFITRDLVAWADDRLRTIAAPGPGYDGWANDMSQYMVASCAENLKRLRGLRFDSAIVDEYVHVPATCKALSDSLTAHGIEHGFEM